MKKTNLLLAGLMLVMFTTTAQTTKWTFDKAHSSIQFDVSHMVISEVTGKFHEYEGTILADKEDFSDAKIDFSIDVKSIDTDNEKRDGHLQSPDFFDVEKYPKITFKSTSIKKVEENQFILTGDFTMHGVTKEITLDVKHGGTITDSYGNIKAGFKISAVIDRTEFGLKYNSVMDAGVLMIGEEVTITCKVELMKMKE